MKKTLQAIGLLFLLQSAKFVFAQNNEADFSVRQVYTVGAGYSHSNTDWSNATMDGFALWGDGRFFQSLKRLDRISVEAEYKDIQFGHPSYLPQLKLQTAQAGFNVGILSWHRVRPFGQALIGLGIINFPLGAIPAEPSLSSKRNLVYTLGGGADYRLTRKMSIRGKYSSQWWPNLADRQTALTPHGWDIGAAYRF